jgi:hypothetical protein
VLALRRGEQVAQERLQAAAGGRLQATAAEEGVGLPHRDQMGGDGSGRTVLGVEVPLQGADERVGPSGSMNRKVKHGKRAPSGTQPMEWPRQRTDQRLRWVSAVIVSATAFPLVRGLLVGATGFEPVTSSVSAKPPGTAVLHAVLPGHRQPSMPKGNAQLTSS